MSFSHLSSIIFFTSLWTSHWIFKICKRKIPFPLLISHHLKCPWSWLKWFWKTFQSKFQKIRRMSPWWWNKAKFSDLFLLWDEIFQEFFFRSKFLRLCTEGRFLEVEENYQYLQVQLLETRQPLSPSLTFNFSTKEQLGDIEIVQLCYPQFNPTNSHH